MTGPGYPMHKIALAAQMFYAIIKTIGNGIFRHRGLVESRQKRRNAMI